MAFYFLILFGLYFVLLFALRFGWANAMQPAKKLQIDKPLFLSVVVPFRNEEDNLEALIRSLSDQDLSGEKWEVIFVNDHSTDGSFQKIQQSKNFAASVTIASLSNETGKKAALAHGVALAQGDVIVTTDADCACPEGWLRNIGLFFQDSTVNMAIGMVALEDERTFFSQWQSMEFASVMGSTVASIGWGKPLMCNGANLAFRKKNFEEVNGYLGNVHIPSGDDEFLMRKILQRHPNSIRLMNSAEAVVVTRPQASWTEFLSQRIRWASKWKSNPSGPAKLLAIFIFLIQASWVLLFFVFPGLGLTTSLIVLSLKITADLIFL